MAAMEHDIYYKHHKDTKARHVADEILARKALERYRAKDATVGEKLTALGVAGVMKTKVKLGMGFLTKPNQRKCYKILEKSKNTLEFCLLNISECKQLLRLNELQKRKKQHQSSIRKRIPKQKKQKNDDLIDVDMSDDFPSDNKKDNVKQKRKYLEEGADNNFKKLKLDDSLQSVTTN